MMGGSRLLERGELALTTLGIVVLGGPVNFLILGTAGIVPFLLYRDFLLIPSLVVLFLMALYAHFAYKRLFHRLVVGLWAGAAATLALEAFRLAFLSLRWLPMDDMMALPGALLTGLVDSTEGFMEALMAATAFPTEVFVIGAIYHFLNGATFGAVYTMILGKARWYYGLAWGIVLHFGMMLAPWMVANVGPFGIGYAAGYNVFVSSFVAHLAWGSSFGLLAQRFVRE